MSKGFPQKTQMQKLYIKIFILNLRVKWTCKMNIEFMSWGWCTRKMCCNESNTFCFWVFKSASLSTQIYKLGVTVIIFWKVPGHHVLFMLVMSCGLSGYMYNKQDFVHACFCVFCINDNFWKLTKIFNLEPSFWKFN